MKVFFADGEPIIREFLCQKVVTGTRFQSDFFLLDLWMIMIIDWQQSNHVNIPRLWAKDIYLCEVTASDELWALTAWTLTPTPRLRPCITLADLAGRVIAGPGMFTLSLTAVHIHSTSDTKVTEIWLNYVVLTLIFITILTSLDPKPDPCFTTLKIS